MEHVSICFIPASPCLKFPQGTGEHGVGVGKKEYLVNELGEGTVEFMRTLKEAVDPLNLLNPGKVKGFRCLDP